MALPVFAPPPCAPLAVCPRRWASEWGTGRQCRREAPHWLHRSPCPPSPPAAESLPPATAPSPHQSKVRHADLAAPPSLRGGACCKCYCVGGWPSLMLCCEHKSVRGVPTTSPPPPDIVVPTSPSTANHHRRRAPHFLPAPLPLTQSARPLRCRSACSAGCPHPHTFSLPPSHSPRCPPVTVQASMQCGLSTSPHFVSASLPLTQVPPCDGAGQHAVRVGL